VSRRTDRLSEEIREEVARIIPALKDPRVGFVTVTRTEMTPDLRTVRVHVGVLGDAVQRERTLKGLTQAAGFVRRELGRRLSIRHTPEVSFHYDEGLDATERVARLLDQVRSGERESGDDGD
jgi:ribosome-binding factor A